MVPAGSLETSKARVEGLQGDRERHVWDWKESGEDGNMILRKSEVKAWDSFSLMASVFCLLLLSGGDFVVRMGAGAELVPRAKWVWVGHLNGPIKKKCWLALREELRPAEGTCDGVKLRVGPGLAGAVLAEAEGRDGLGRAKGKKY